MMKTFVSRRAVLAAAASSAVLLSGCATTEGSDAGSLLSDVDSKHQVIVAMNPTSEPAAGFDLLMSWGCG